MVWIVGTHSGKWKRSPGCGSVSDEVSSSSAVSVLEIVWLGEAELCTGAMCGCKQPRREGRLVDD